MNAGAAATSDVATPAPPLTTRRRESCARCERPPRVCYCAALPPQPLATSGAHVLVLQHRHEKRHRNAISSVPVLTHVLNTASATVVTVDDNGAALGVSDALDRLLFCVDPSSGGSDCNEPFARVLVLFPDAAAKTLSADLLASLTPAAPVRAVEAASTDDNATANVMPPRTSTLLVVVDGTWTEAKKIVFHSRAHLETLAMQRRARGLAFEFICLDTDASSNGCDDNTSDVDAATTIDSVQATSGSSLTTALPRTSIYGELRREPMAGCLSTLEAVALALQVLEPSATRTLVPAALLQGFRAMVALQAQCMARGKQQALAKHNGVSKHDAIAQRQQRQSRPTAAAPSTSSTVDRTANAPPLKRVREYVFYTTRIDFRHRKHVEQQGESVTCTYDDARAQCEARNSSRKRGERLAFLARDVFDQQTQQQSTSSK